MLRLSFLVFAATLASCAASTERVSKVEGASASTEPALLVLQEPSPERSVPIAIYGPADAKAPRPLAVISHAYGGTHTAYGFIAHALEARGYLVVSIQHELPGDAPLPNTGNIARDRMPAWRQGEKSILFVIDELRRRGLASAAPVVLVGHSMGGDMVMLMARDHPERFAAAISLDNRRVALPRTRAPRICSIRSSDQTADPGVLPAAEEAAAFGMTIVNGRDLNHDEMWDAATQTQKEQILEVILGCL